MNLNENRCLASDNMAGVVGRVSGGSVRGIGHAEAGQQAEACAVSHSDSDRQFPPHVRVAVEVPANSTFSDALMHARRGGRITRKGWNAGGQHVEAQYPDKGSRMGAPYLVLKNVENLLVPWAPSQGDLFACDWALLP